MSQMTLIFTYNGTYMTIQCKGNDTLKSVFDRYCMKAGFQKNDPTFYYNEQKIFGDYKTIIEHGIPDKAVFNVVLSKYVSGAKIN